jgi:large subunit ribosomal protein L19
VSQELIRKAVASKMRKDLPEFHIGDTVNVLVKIVEGDKERVQGFSGVVIGRRGGSTSETFTVRRIVNNEGVERTFPVHSPRIAGIEVIRGGGVRRAKLYFLRQRVGKATRLKDTVHKEAKASATKETSAAEPAKAGQASS